MPTSVLLVGCCEVHRLGFRCLKAQSDFDWVFDEAEPLSAPQQLERSRYDVVIIDTNIPGIGLLELMESIRRVVKKQAFLLFAFHENPVVIAQAADLGVLGLILYSHSTSKIVERIREAANGQSAWSREDLRRMAASSSTLVRKEGYYVPLTHREKDILKNLVKGWTNKEIAAGLGITYETVKEHIQNILAKVGVNDRSQAAVWAVHNYIV
jgi:DNA-binding NarL/FixJ family response regulator